MNYLKLMGIAAFAIGVILYLASADDHKLVKGHQDHDLGEYVKISYNIAAKVTVNADDVYGIDINAQEEDLKNIKIYVKGKTLIIEHRKRIFPSWQGSTPEITLSLPRLKKFTHNGSAAAAIEGIHGDFFKAVVNGSGSISFQGKTEEMVGVINGSGALSGLSYDAEEATIYINGSGAATLAGKCEELEVEINGSGRFAGQDYICEEVEVEIMGSGDVTVHATDELEVDVMGSGNVNVYGNPEKVINRSSVGKHIIIH